MARATKDERERNRGNGRNGRNDGGGSAALTLAVWQLRQTWGLLLVTGAGIVAAVMLVCAVPLYSEVAMSAGLRGVLTVSAQTTDVVVSSTSEQISLPVIDKATRNLDRELQQYLGPYLGGSEFSIETKELLVNPANGGRRRGGITKLIGLISAPMERAGPHAKVLQGRLPNANGDTLEVALLPEAASSLNVRVGSTFTISVPFMDASQSVFNVSVPLHVVGIFQLADATDPFWHGNDFTNFAPSDFVIVHKGLVSNGALLSVLARLSGQAAKHGQVLTPAPSVYWYYHLAPSHIAIGDLSTIINGVNTIKLNTGNDAEFDQSPLLQDTVTYQQSDILDQYLSRTSVAQLPVVSLLVLMLGLVLFFVSMMADLLVERQGEEIAVLHSRGASWRQIFTSLVVQSVGVGVIALVGGPLLAVGLVRFIAERSLAVADQGALNLISTNVVQAGLGLGWYALLAVVATLMAMVLAIRQAMSRDVLAVRREAARSTRVPLWQRLNLDIVAAIIALTGYGFSLYMTNSGVLDAHLRLLLLSPLTLLEAAFLLIAIILLFLRFFPRILQLGTWLATRGRGAAPTLALAQMARTPRQPVRMTLLLTLASAFAFFTLIFTASQSQRIVDIAAYQGGADFSGGISNGILTPAQLANQQAAYGRIHGVSAVSFGYTTPAVAGGRGVGLPVNFTAVDANTFANVAIWTQQDSTQPLSTLMRQLAGLRATVSTRKAVPAIVDAQGWDALHLSPGANFVLNFGTSDYNDLVNFTAIAEVQHIPTSADAVAPGILVDYLSYVKVYTKNYASSNFIVPMNYIWLRSQSDAGSLTSIRKALNQGDLQLSPLYDRRAQIDTLYHEPLYLALTGVLALGASTALLLALFGNLIVSWISTRSRLTNFAVLRAIGASPGQVASTLTWEMAIIYATAIVLGVIFGSIFSFLVIPGLVFTSVAPSGTTSQVSSGSFYSLQGIPPIQIVIPDTLGFALVALIVICVITLAMMVRVVSRPSISQTLRLNED